MRKHPVLRERPTFYARNRKNCASYSTNWIKIPQTLVKNRRLVHDFQQNNLNNFLLAIVHTKLEYMQSLTDMIMDPFYLPFITLNMFHKVLHFV